MEHEVAVVSGAAGGIGAEVVRALRERGAVVAAVDRDPEGLAAIAGAGVTGFPADVSDSGQVADTVAAIEDRLGPVEYLVNAAGVLRLGEATKLTEQDWHTTFAVNTTGVFHLSRAVAVRMMQRSRGAIVTVASNAASTPRLEMAAYAASKAAATMFTKCLGLELAGHGIRCNVVAPGSTDSPMLSSMWHDESGPKTTVRGSLDTYRLGIPLGRIAAPADIANAVTFLLSARASHITMHELTVDGGATLGS
ncbi:2,3-dihydro-2,3-dihydroxybenzoate dehydrogenase [Sciscionella sediminilitoris]|uniref:2,3-dihydro-2,3-dihydroxybenzoate dehydrogenase n=1 Tax=Sciscionella sediminilitoris TaxID=1445613 RepID=UPI0004DF870F|nr:2,3-dihydro-2,3-dihydroxybenzoate dehydrogenase [Sciscionella sp. SE31]